MDLDNTANAIKSKNDKNSFFEEYAKWHAKRNAAIKNEIILRVIILRSIIRRGSRLTKA